MVKTMSIEVELLAFDVTQLANYWRIARVCHEANRAYCQTIQDYSLKSWEASPEWQQKSCLDGVLFLSKNPEAGPEASHENWSATKLKEGWKYGQVKDPDKKEHPCLVPFNELPAEQQMKDKIFHAIARAMLED
jgi:hypothetical protein